MTPEQFKIILQFLNKYEAHLEHMDNMLTALRERL